MSDFISPVQVEQRILQLNNRIAEGIKVCDERLRLWQEAERNFDKTLAVAYLGAEGTAKEREMEAKLKAMDAREKMDFAEAEYKYADRLAKALELELRGMQSIGASLRTAYGVAGRGEN